MTGAEEMVGTSNRESLGVLVTVADAPRPTRPFGHLIEAIVGSEQQRVVAWIQTERVNVRGIVCPNSRQSGGMVMTFDIDEDSDQHQSSEAGENDRDEDAGCAAPFLSPVATQASWSANTVSGHTEPS